MTKFKKGQRVLVRERTRYQHTGPADIQEYTMLPILPHIQQPFQGIITMVFDAGDEVGYEVQRDGSTDVITAYTDELEALV